MKKFHYSLGELSKRLLKIGAPQTKMIVLATIGSIIGNLSRMGLMGFGAALILYCAGTLESGSYAL
ncbi:MAG: hypothetical protein IJU50_02290, partial [Lachnospiraceae bacterium]|nr:hypothetical protein [Lachnospiraceae bacterium]